MTELNHQFKTVVATYFDDFDTQCLAMLNKGYKFHGFPFMTDKGIYQCFHLIEKIETETKQGLGGTPKV